MTEPDPTPGRPAADLFPLVYAELRRLAAARLAGEAPGHTLTATALAHEAYLKLAGPGGERAFADPGHLLAVAAEVVRHVLVDRARARGRLRRGGDRRRVALRDPAAVPGLPPDDLLDLSDALDALAAEAPAPADVARLRLFGGLSVAEAGDALGVSRATADRHWAYARAWLHDRLSADG